MTINQQLIAIAREEALDEGKKKKKPYDSATYTTGDPDLNIAHFNKMLSGKEANTHTDGYLNGTFKGPDGSTDPSGAIGGGDSSGGEGGGIGESLELDEDTLYTSKFAGTDNVMTEIELPNDIELLDKSVVEDTVTKLEPEELFTVGYVTPLYFYKELADKFTLLKCTELEGYTGIDYIEARADDPVHKNARLNIANSTAALGTNNGVHFDRQPLAGQEADFSANYEITNRTVKQHRSGSQAVIDKRLNTILFYPKIGSRPKLVYYIDIKNGDGFYKVSREVIESTILKRVAEIADELDTGVKKDGTPRQRRWDDARLAAKIRNQLAIDAATITAKPLDAEKSIETRSRITNGLEAEKPQVRALYTNQIYYLKTKHGTLGTVLSEGLNLKEDNPNETLTEVKRYVRRYYMKPQNEWLSNKDEVLKALIDHEDEDCVVYTLNKQGDIKDQSKLNNNDVIYYYEDGILYDKNHVRIMDYVLSIKHEEERPHINPETTSDAKLADIYADRMTGVTELEEAFNLDFDSFNAYGEKLYEGHEHGKCCICGEEIDGYGNNPEPYHNAENGERCCDACNLKFVIPARLAQINSKEEK